MRINYSKETPFTLEELREINSKKMNMEQVFELISLLVDMKPTITGKQILQVLNNLLITYEEEE